MEKVSVIIATYNSEKTIDRLIRSILNQQGINERFTIEIIIADDASRDRTIEIASAYPVAILPNEKNSGGPNKGRNNGLRFATGDYICIADHDDEWHDDKIINTIDYLKKVPIVTSGYILYDSIKSAPLDRSSHVQNGYIYYGINETFIRKLTKSNAGQSAYLGSLIYRSNLKNIEFEEIHGQVDFDWVLKLFRNNDSIEVSQPLYNRFVDGSNLSLNINYRTTDYLYSIKTVEEYAAEFPKEARLGIKRLHGSFGRYHYLMNSMKEARKYLLMAGISPKILAYYLTTFCCSRFIVKHFHILG